VKGGWKRLPSYDRDTPLGVCSASSFPTLRQYHLRASAGSGSPAENCSFRLASGQCPSRIDDVKGKKNKQIIGANTYEDGIDELSTYVYGLIYNQ